MAQAISMELTAPPRIFVLYGRGAVARKPGLAPGVSLPEIRVSLRGVKSKRSNVAAYAKVCGFSSYEPLPLTYPFVSAFPLAIQIMSHASFPLPLLGTIHLQNKISLHRPITLQDALDFDCAITATRWADNGVEFDITTHATSGGTEVWTCVSTFLRRVKGLSSGANGKAKPTRAEPLQGSAREEWKLPADLGRRYALVSGDFNPIHIASLTAKAFGFPRAIAHGMWSKARAVAALGAEVSSRPVEVDVRFKAPVLLPSRAVFVSERKDGTTLFELQAAKGDKVHLSGTVRPL